MKVSQSIYVQLQTIHYNEAVERYNNLRTWFLSEFSAAARNEDANIRAAVEEQIAQEINSKSLEAEVPHITKELYTILDEALSAAISDGKAREKIKKIKTEYKTGQEKAKKEAIKQAEILGEALLPEEELRKIITETLSKLQVGSTFSIDDILAQVKGYRTRYLTRSKSKKHAINITKGYYQEALIYQAFLRIAETLESPLSVLDAGAIKVDGKDTLYDTYLRFADHLQKSEFQQIISEQLDLGYGLQSKSWKIPITDNEADWKALRYKYGFNLGSRQALLASSGLKGEPFVETLWLRGVQFLEQQAVEAIGKNQVGFVVPGGFIWTADLITNFRSNQYYLAFGQTKDSFSSSAIWTPVEVET